MRSRPAGEEQEATADGREAPEKSRDNDVEVFASRHSVGIFQSARKTRDRKAKGERERRRKEKERREGRTKEMECTE